jgi:transcriptional regulator with XRE-family HTH domain
MKHRFLAHWVRLKRNALEPTREELAERVEYSAGTIRKYQIGMVLAYWFEAQYEDALEQAMAYTLESNHG